MKFDEQLSMPRMPMPRTSMQRTSMQRISHTSWQLLTYSLLTLVIAIGFLPTRVFSQSATTQSADTHATTTPANASLKQNLAAEAQAKQQDSLSDKQAVNDKQSSTQKITQATASPAIASSAVFTGTCGGLAQQAEDGVLSGNFAIGSDLAASNGKYIYTANGTGNFYNGLETTTKAELCFTVTVTGTYYMRASTFAEDTLSDSFYAQVDGAPEAGYLWDIFPAASYVIDYINDRFFADPVELQLTPGQHIVRFYPREDGARLDTVELILTTDNPGPVPTCAGMKQEAEDGALRGAFEIGNDVAASGGGYIHIPEGLGHYWYGPNTLQSAKYCFNVPATGIYRIDAKVYAPDILSDSFYVRVDNAPARAFLWDTLINTSYLTDSLNNRLLADPITLKLVTGQHTVTVYAREDGTRLDTLELVYTDAYTPPIEPPIIALPISGTIRPNTDGLTEEVDFSEIFVRLIDAQTRGQKYSQRVQVDRIGRYQLEGMPPGAYILVLELPEIYETKNPEVAIIASATQGINVSFDIALKQKHVYLPVISN